jgi:5-methyltetrahydropteroyltriglutamate--homocysteine methyltransferase
MSAPKLFPTQEVGSLMKPRWLVLGLKGEALPPAALEEFVAWNRRVNFVPEHDPRVKKLLKGQVKEVGPQGLRDLGALFGIRYLEKAGLDIVYDGEARRVEMYEYPIRQMDGFQFLGHVRSFENKYYLKAASTGPVGLKQPYHLDEFDFVKEHARRPPKVPVTGAYTLADWSWNEHYLKRQKGWKGRAARRAAQAELIADLAKKALRPTLKALIAHGATNIQIDEPAAGTHPDEAELVVQAFNDSTQGLSAKFSMHICYSDYRSLYPALLEAKGCSQFLWEFANRDTPDRDGYEPLHLFEEFDDGREVGLGVTDIHRDGIESPEKIRDRILHAARVLGDPARVYVNPDCGLRTRSLEVAYQKLTNMVRGAELARAALR